MCWIFNFFFLGKLRMIISLRYKKIRKKILHCEKFFQINFVNKFLAVKFNFSDHLKCFCLEEISLSDKDSIPSDIGKCFACEKNSNEGN